MNALTPQQKQRYSEISAEVDVDLFDIMDELEKAILRLGNEQRFVRTRLLLSFSILEISANIYNAYFDLKLPSTKLLPKWIGEYCLVEGNPTYAGHVDLKKITIEHLYKFRNSIIHAFALPDPENGLSIVSPNGADTSDILEKYREGLVKAGAKVAFISPDTLTKLFLDALTLLHPQMFVDAEVASESHLAGMERVHGEMHRRGAKGIPLV